MPEYSMPEYCMAEYSIPEYSTPSDWHPSIPPSHAGLWLCIRCGSCASCGAKSPGSEPDSKWQQEVRNRWPLDVVYSMNYQLLTPVTESFSLFSDASAIVYSRSLCRLKNRCNFLNTRSTSKFQRPANHDARALLLVLFLVCFDARVRI